MTDPRYSIDDAVPEWKHPEDPLETRIGPDGQVAVKLVLWDPSDHTEPTTYWVRISGRCGQLTLDQLNNDTVATWRVC